MNKLVVGSFSFLLLLLASSGVFASADHPVAYPLSVKVTMDGKYTTSAEWSDTSELEIAIGLRGVVAYFRAKYDAKYLYTLWDYVECQKAFQGNSSANPTQVLMYLDPMSKRSQNVDSSMYRFTVATGYLPAGKVAISRGTDKGAWTGWDSSSSAGITSAIQYTSSPHSTARHMIAEIRVPLTFADLQSHVHGAISLGLRFADYWTKVFAEYPEAFNHDNPSTWGTMEFSAGPMPSFSANTLQLLPIVAVTLNSRRA